MLLSMDKNSFHMLKGLDPRKVDIVDEILFRVCLHSPSTLGLGHIYKLFQRVLVDLVQVAIPLFPKVRLPIQKNVYLIDVFS